MIMVSHRYHYWIRVLLQHLKLTDRPFAWDLRNKYEGGAVVAVKETQTVAVKAKGKSPARTFEAETTMRLDDPTTLVIDGYEDGDFGSMNVAWEKISSISCSYSGPLPRLKSDTARIDVPNLFRPYLRQ
jgi:hypothetical protein